MSLVVGQEGKDGTSSLGTGNMFVTGPFIASLSGPLLGSGWVLATGASVTVRLALYADSAGLPANLASGVTAEVSTTVGLVRLPWLDTPPPIIAGVSYWVGLWPGNSGNFGTLASGSAVGGTVAYSSTADPAAPQFGWGSPTPPGFTAFFSYQDDPGQSVLSVLGRGAGW